MPADLQGEDTDLEPPFPDPGEMPGLSVCKGHNPKTNNVSKAKRKPTETIINNLPEFLSWRGFGADEARHWARCFYKYTDCGPWVVFIMKDADTSENQHAQQVAKFRKRGNMATLTNVKQLRPDFAQFLGFDTSGLDRKKRSWDTYVGLVQTFIADNDKVTRTGKAIEIVKLTATAIVRSDTSATIG